eukprot:gene20409-24445_t
MGKLTNELRKLATQPKKRWEAIFELLASWITHWFIREVLGLGEWVDFFSVYNVEQWAHPHEGDSATSSGKHEEYIPGMLEIDVNDNDIVICYNASRLRSSVWKDFPKDVSPKYRLGGDSLYTTGAVTQNGRPKGHIDKNVIFVEFTYAPAQGCVYASGTERFFSTRAPTMTSVIMVEDSDVEVPEKTRCYAL